MKSLIATGTHATLWSIQAPDLEKDMQPFAVTSIILRTSDTPYEPDWAWDLDCGVYVYGKTQDVEKAFEKIKQFMIEKLDEEVWDGLVPQDSPSNFGLFKSLKYDTAIIIGAGHYEETEQRMLDVINSLENVKVGELGANYSDDDEFFKVLSNLVEDRFDQNQTVEDFELQILAEYFSKTLAAIDQLKL